MPSSGMLESLAIQAGYLRKRLEIHLLGNHLLANAKALVFAGLFFRGRIVGSGLRCCRPWGVKYLLFVRRLRHRESRY